MNEKVQGKEVLNSDYLTNWRYSFTVSAIFLKSIPNGTVQLADMFWISYDLIVVILGSAFFWRIRTYLRTAMKDSSSDLHPDTILAKSNIRRIKISSGKTDTYGMFLVSLRLPFIQIQNLRIESKPYIRPEAKIKQVDLGFRILITQGAKRFGLYSTFLQFVMIFFRSKVRPTPAEATTFLKI